MAWFKTDDSFGSHPKVLALPRGAARMRSVGLWTLAGTWAAKQETDGHVPAYMIEELGGTKADAKRLVDVTLWEVTDTGYLFHDWAEYQPTSSDKESDREAARERMRKLRAKKGPKNAGTTGDSEDGSEDVRANKDRSSENVRSTPTRPVPDPTAAAAADAAAAVDSHTTTDLPGPVAILATKLAQHTPLRGLRWDLPTEKLDRITTCVTEHGDQALVDNALATLRTPAPTYASAFLGNWEAMPPPGQRLALVAQRLCDVHGTRLTPSGNCSSCAADAKVGGDR
ncbi:hypothetical protein [Nocardioides jensenii]|uniref:hypothetical protein n=1 Tax=Nocardioides jensenii TaxID=1843 RepID=UPI00082BBBF7|nr:hypothetical protein [Nocardioides jensenii]